MSAKLKQYDSNVLNILVARVKAGDFTVYQASKESGTPKNTIMRRVKGIVNLDKKPGVCPALDEAAERKLVGFIKKSCDIGFNLKVKDIRQKAYEVVDHCKRKHRFSRNKKMASAK